MSVLFWAFLAGGLAVGFPLVFHLIRRTPKGQQAFSSLMFLRSTPPRLTRRSRLDDLLLLLLRALAILLLVAAFMRPYWRAAAELSLDSVRGRRVALLIDTSASMRRGNLWQQAVEQAEQTLDELSPADRVALFSYDGQLHTHVGFAENMNIERGQQAALIKQKLQELSPSWHDSQLGRAMVQVAEVLGETGDREYEESLQVVVVTDLQAGSQLSELQAFQWPEEIRVALERVSLPDNSNATVQLLEASDDAETTAEPLVRVTNAADSTVDQFQVHWSTAADGSGDSNPGQRSVPFYVPPGQSRVLPVPREGQSLAATRLQMTGEQAAFDNTEYVVPVQQQTVRLAYLGNDDRNDPEGMRFYLERALSETPRRKIVVEAYATDEPIALLPDQLPELIVVTSSISPGQSESIDKYVSGGGSALVVLSRESLDSLGTLLPSVTLDETAAPADENDYRLLGEIDFGHSLFAPFANPRYNDFTNIHFWNYTPIGLAPDDGQSQQLSLQVIARFDNGKPALWQESRGTGTIYVLAAGWHPRESQLALSNKFVPLMEELLALCSEPPLAATSYAVGESIPLPAESSNSSRMVTGPAGNELAIPASDTHFREANKPGIYILNSAGTQQAFAVNLARSESDTQPLNSEQLEQLGVKLGWQASQVEELDRLRQLRDVELESRQKMWKWLVVAALLVLALEMGVAAWRSRGIGARQGEIT